MLVGGRDRSRTFSCVWKFAIGSRRWALLRKLPHGLHSHSAAAWDVSGRTSSKRDEKTVIIVTGGLSGDGFLSANTNIYVIKLCEKHEVRKPKIDVIRTRGPYIPRFGHTSHVYRSRLFLVGGVAASGNEQPGVGIVDLISGTSVELQVETGIPAADICLYNHCSCLQEADGERPRIFVFGGGGNCFSFGSHFSRRCLEIDVAMAIELVSEG